MHRTSGGNLLILFFGDLVVFTSSLVLALALRYREWPSQEIINEHLIPFISLFLLWSAVFFIAGLYDTYVSLSRKSIPGSLLKVQGLNMLLAVVFFFVFPIGITPKTTLALYLAVSILLLAFWRLYIFPQVATGKPIRAVIIGSGAETKALTLVLRDSPYFRFMSAEVIDIDEHKDLQERQQELLSYIDENEINMVVGDVYDDRSVTLIQLYYNLTFLNRDVRFVALHHLYEQLCHRIPPSLVSEMWMLEHVSKAPQRLYTSIKRAIDIVGSLVLGALSLIVYPFVIYAIKREGEGPIFFRQERIGLYNVPIQIIKFRTMNGIDDSRSALKSTLHVTRIGQFLRKTRLDELPQLWNVFRGDLSFVGPRPEIPSLVQVYAEKIPYYNMRHLTKPGLSGWAQINNFDVPRKGIDVERTIEKLSFDLFYLKRRSILFDIEIVLKTIKTLISRSGT